MGKVIDFFWADIGDTTEKVARNWKRRRDGATGLTMPALIGQDAWLPFLHRGIDVWVYIPPLRPWGISRSTTGRPWPHDLLVLP